MLSALVGLAAIVAFSATPAAAFKSGQKQGNINVIESGEFTLGTAVKVVCPPAEIKAQWHIQGKGQIKTQQTETTQGPDMLVQVKEWGPSCTTKVSGSAGVPTMIKACNLRLVQRQTTLASGGVGSPCLIKVGTGSEPTCEIQIPAGMETGVTTDQGINVGLLKTELGAGANMKATVNVTEGGIGQLEGEAIFGLKVGKNPICPVPAASEKYELRGLVFKAEGAESV
jgi:hypothetical protein